MGWICLDNQGFVQETLTEKAERQMMGYLYAKIERNRNHGADMQWWSVHHAEFEDLAQLARRFLGAPASSAASERVFKQASLVCMARRNRLGGERTAMLLFLKFNIRALDLPDITPRFEELDEAAATNSDDNEAPKQLCKNMKQISAIGTHNGRFHCGEVFACFLLKQMPECIDAEIIRSRDPEVLDTCDIVVDVGGIYDAKMLKFDHHQRSFTDSMKTILPAKKSFTTKLSSAGLIYAHFGHRILSILLEHDESSLIIDAMFDKLYRCFIEEIDAVDNGVDQCSCEAEPRYLITTKISDRVDRLYPLHDCTPVLEDTAFNDALKMVGTEFIDRLSYYHNIWWPARVEVMKVMNDRFNVDDSGEIMAFPPRVSVPWKDHFFELEKTMGIDNPTIKFVLFREHKKDSWIVYSVNLRPGTFELRVPLLAAWRGLRDKELSEITKLKGCIFVHASGFIGGHHDYDGALLMAKKSLKGEN